MKKINIKLLMIIFVCLMLMALPVSAKKITSIEELGKTIESIEPDAYYAYIVGEYAFTNANGKISIQDIMMGATSINITNKTDKNQMNVYTIESTTKWDISDNLIGNETLNISAESPIEIKYVDYQYVSEDSEIADINLNITNYNNKLLKQDFINSNYSKDLEITKDNNNYKVKGLLLNKKADPIEGLESNQTGYYMAFALNIPGLNNNSKLTIKDVDEDGYSKTFTSDDYKTDSDNGTAIIWPVNPNSESKKIEIILDIDGAAELYGETKYYLTWDEELKFQGESKLSINLDFDSDTLTSVKEKFGYEKTKEDTYTLSGLDEATKTYTLTGDVIYQEGPIKYFANDDPKGYYVLINISNESFIPGETTIKLNGNKEKNFTLTDKSLVLLLALNSEESTKEYTITIDLDGEGNLYLPVVYKLKYDTDLHFKKQTEFTMTIDKAGVNPDYNYNVDNYKTIILDNNALTGSVLITKDVKKTTLGENNLTDYYVPIKLDIIDKSESTKIKINGTETTDTTLLLPLTESKKKDEIFTIEIDNDGDENKYIAKKIELTYKDLIFQGNSTVRFVSTELNGEFSNQFDVTKQSALAISLNENNATISLKNTVYAQEDKNEYVAFAITINKMGEEPQFDLNATSDGQIMDSKEVQATVPNAVKKVFLYKLPSDLSQSAKLTIDLDGKDGNSYSPKTYTIDFSGINLIKLYTITFTDVTGYGEYKPINVYSNELQNLKVEDPAPTNSYVTFDHWVDANSESHDEVNLKEITKDVTVKPYFNVDLDGYMNDYQTKFNVDGVSLEKDVDSYNFKITDPTFAQKSLESLSSINLVNKLSSILSDFKVTKLTINGTDVSDASNVADTLNNKLNSYSTYADLINDADFAITVKVTGSDAYKLKDATEKTYIFKFVSDFRIATTKKELTNALSNENVKTIYIKGTIDLDTENLSITRPNLTIEGLNNGTLKSSNSDSVIKVSNDTTIKNLIINSNNASSKGILVTSGTLTADKLTVQNTKEGTDGVATAIEIESLANANVTNLTYEDESYDSPAIRAEGEKNVTLNRGNKNVASAKTYEVVTTYENNGKNYRGDIKEAKANYNYKHYYLNNDNESKWFTLIFEGDKGIVRAAPNFYRYVEKKDINTKWSTYAKTMLNGDIKNLTTYIDESKKYGVNDICGSLSSGQKCVTLENLNELPIPTSDTNYVVKLKYVSEVNGVIIADTVDKLREYLGNNDYTKIYLKENTVFDLGNEPLKITRPVIINGKFTTGLVLSSTIKGQIIIDSPNVSFNQLIVKGTGEGENVITVNEKDFYLYQTELSIEKNAKFKNMIYYSLDLPKTDILFTKFNDQQNVLTSFIEFSQSVGTSNADDQDDLKTELLGNTFVGGTNMKTYIKIDSLHNENPLNIDLRQSSFKFQNEDAYALEIAKTPTGNSAINFDFGISSILKDSKADKIRVRIDVDSNGGNASSITFNKDYRFNNLEVHYFQGDKDNGTTNPKGKSSEATVKDYGN